MHTQEVVDVVFTWVDGADPAHRAKRMARGGGGSVTLQEDVGGECRYSSTGELFYAVGSILRFAPWVRKIHIVTDNQDPHIDQWVERNFPNSTTEIVIVDHKVIFRDYEECLPTFNSISIESMLWRIPDLAECHLYFNDDMFLTREVEPSLWFEGDKTYIYAKRFSTLAGRLLRWLKPKRGGRKPFGYKDAMVNAARLLGSNHFWLFPHAPQPLRRSWYERFFATHTEQLEQNIRHPFRDRSQWSYVSLFMIEGQKEGVVQVRPRDGMALFLKPSARKQSGYMERKLREADHNPNLHFGCINSLGEASPEEQKMFHEWAGRLIGVKE